MCRLRFLFFMSFFLTVNSVFCDSFKETEKLYLQTIFNRYLETRKTDLGVHFEDYSVILKMTAARFSETDLSNELRVNLTEKVNRLHAENVQDLFLEYLHANLMKFNHGTRIAFPHLNAAWNHLKHSDTPALFRFLACKRIYYSIKKLTPNDQKTLTLLLGKKNQLLSELINEDVFKGDLEGFNISLFEYFTDDFTRLAVASLCLTTSQNANPLQHYLRGIIQEASRNTAGAVEAYRSAAEGAPNVPEPFCALMRIAALEKQFKKAGESLKRLLESHSDHWFFQRNLQEMVWNKMPLDALWSVLFSSDQYSSYEAEITQRIEWCWLHYEALQGGLARLLEESPELINQRIQYCLDRAERSVGRDSDYFLSSAVCLYYVQGKTQQAYELLRKICHFRSFESWNLKHSSTGLIALLNAEQGGFGQNCRDYMKTLAEDKELSIELLHKTIRDNRNSPEALSYVFSTLITEEYSLNEAVAIFLLEAGYEAPLLSRLLNMPVEVRSRFIESASGSSLREYFSANTLDMLMLHPCTTNLQLKEAEKERATFLKAIESIKLTDKERYLADMLAWRSLLKYKPKNPNSSYPVLKKYSYKKRFPTYARTGLRFDWELAFLNDKMLNHDLAAIIAVETRRAGGWEKAFRKRKTKKLDDRLFEGESQAKISGAVQDFFVKEGSCEIACLLSHIFAEKEQPIESALYLARVRTLVDSLNYYCDNCIVGMMPWPIFLPNLFYPALLQYVSRYPGAEDLMIQCADFLTAMDNNAREPQLVAVAIELEKGRGENAALRLVYCAEKTSNAKSQKGMYFRGEKIRSQSMFYEMLLTQTLQQAETLTEPVRSKLERILDNLSR